MGMERTSAGGELGERQALDDLFSATYEELRRLAGIVKRDDPSLTLNPTALVNEAWLKLAKSPAFASTSPLHFKRIAARAMRQVLVEAARRRNSQKRGGGGETVLVPMADSLATVSHGGDVLAMEAALQELERTDPRQV